MSILVYVFAAIALLGIIGTGVHKVKEWGADEVRSEWTAANLKAKSEAEARIAKADADLAAERAKKKIVYRTIEKVVQNEIKSLVYVDRCITDRGVCLVNAAIRGEGGDACKSDGAVPAAKPAD